MKPQIWKNALAAGLLAVLYFSWNSNILLENISKGISMNKQEIFTKVVGRPTCASYFSEPCQVTLMFYQRDNETAGEFAKRMKAEIAEFEQNWGG